MSDENDEQQLQAGDRVRLLSGLYEDQQEGDLGTVVATFSQGDCDVKVDRDQGKWYFLRGEVEKVDEDASSKDTNPLRYEVWVGDTLVAAFRSEELRASVRDTMEANLRPYFKVRP